MNPIFQQAVDKALESFHREKEPLKKPGEEYRAGRENGFRIQDDGKGLVTIERC